MTVRSTPVPEDAGADDSPSGIIAPKIEIQEEGQACRSKQRDVAADDSRECRVLRVGVAWLLSRGLQNASRRASRLALVPAKRIVESEEIIPADARA
jgi:hypothetical protein